MKPEDEGNTRMPAPQGSPLDGRSESGTSGSGSGTAMAEMLRKRGMRRAPDTGSHEGPSDERGTLQD